MWVRHGGRGTCAWRAPNRLVQAGARVSLGHWRPVFRCQRWPTLCAQSRHGKGRCSCCSPALPCNASARLRSPSVRLCRTRGSPWRVARDQTGRSRQSAAGERLRQAWRRRVATDRKALPSPSQERISTSPSDGRHIRCCPDLNYCARNCALPRGLNQRGIFSRHSPVLEATAKTARFVTPRPKGRQSCT